MYYEGNIYIYGAFSTQVSLDVSNYTQKGGKENFHTGSEVASALIGKYSRSGLKKRTSMTKVSRADVTELHEKK